MKKLSQYFVVLLTVVTLGSYVVPFVATTQVEARALDEEFGYEDPIYEDPGTPVYEEPVDPGSPADPGDGGDTGGDTGGGDTGGNGTGGGAQGGTASAPTVWIQYGDDGGTQPTLPSRCSNQLGAAGTVTYDSRDPDCLRVSVVDDPSTVYNNDFRFCLSYNGVRACTSWASETGTNETRSGMTSGNGGGDLRGYMYAIVETRPLSSTSLPPNTTFSNVQMGVALAYQKDYNACQSSSGMQFNQPNNGGWSAWAYGANQDNDPGCFQVGMRVNSLNSPADAEYVSNTVPSTLNPGSVYTHNKKIVMRNKGLAWPLLNESNSVVRDTDGHCNEGNFNYNPDGSNTCTDYKIFSSQRFRLERLDTTSVTVRSKQLRPNSNDVTYDNGTYSYSQPDTVITAQSNRGNLNTSNTIPFYVKQQITYHRETGSYEICVPGNPEPGTRVGDDPYMESILNYGKENKTLAERLKGAFIKTAEAAPYYDGTGETCEIYEYDYITGTADNWSVDIVAGEEADFAPINISTPTGNGNYTLRFRMVDLNNLNNNGQGYQQGAFGDVAEFSIQVGAPWNLYCSANQNVIRGSQGSYVIWASGSIPGPITVSMSSNPAGPTLANSVVLSSGNSYTSTAFVNTAGLGAGNYTLTFIGTDGVNPTGDCSANITVTNPPPIVDLDFNGSDGPVALNGSTTSGTLSWSSTNTTSCTASTSPSAVTPAFSGGVAINGSSAVSGLAYGTNYVFTLTCTGVGGTHSDSVSVSTAATPPNPTADLMCIQNGSNSQQACATNWGGTGALHWASQFTTACSVSDDNANLPDIGNVPLNMSPSTPYNTGNLYTTTTFTLRCQGMNGTTPHTETLTITVSANPNYTFTLGSTNMTREQGQTAPINLITSNPTEGFNAVVTFSTKSMSPTTAVMPVVSSISPSSLTPPGVSLATITTVNATPGVYTIVFAANGGGVAEKTQTFMLTIDPATPPQPVAGVTASNAVCSTISVSWTPHATHTSLMEYRVYKNTDGGDNWTYITTLPFQAGQTSYSYSDPSPNSSSNYYSVVTYSGSSASSRAVTSPTSPQTCSVNVDFSNKDLIRVNNNTSSAGGDVDNRCNGQSDVFTLPNEQIFKDGDKVYFRINVCNNGNIAMTNVRVTESVSVQHLTNITYEAASTAPSGCVTNADNATKTYTLADLPAATNGNPSICSFVLSATVSSGGGPANQLSRFQNIATITYSQGSKTVYTPKYLFSVGSGVPDRNEIAP